MTYFYYPWLWPLFLFLDPYPPPPIDHSDEDDAGTWLPIQPGVN
jgi:hypothetical protein